MIPIAEYTFGQGLLTVLTIFVFMAWILVLVNIIGDIFRDHEMSGWGKAGWILFLIFIPFLAALIYLIARGTGMRERAIKQHEADQKQLDAYVKQTAGGASAADEVAKLAKLRDEGTITRRGVRAPEGEGAGLDELVEGALPRLLVVAPAHDLGAVADAAARGVVVGDLDHELGTHLPPLQLAVRVPAAGIA